MVMPPLSIILSDFFYHILKKEILRDRLRMGKNGTTLINFQ